MFKVKPIYVFILFMSGVLLRGIILIRPTDLNHHVLYFIISLFTVVGAGMYGASGIKYDNHEP